MEQKIPNINESDIKRIIERDFPEMTFLDVETVLRLYNSETDKGRYRLYASVLKLSDGDFALLKKYVDDANDDYRDIISMAEYPNYTEHAFDDDLSIEMEEQLINDDWVQYESWFNRV